MTTARAAQPNEPAGPSPAGVQSHRWTTMDEYAAQIALPLHRLLAAPIIPEEGVPHYETACGLVVGEVMLRQTGDPKAVTCKKCKGSRKK